MKHSIPGFGSKYLYKWSKFIRTAEKETCYDFCNLISKYKTWYHIICSQFMPNTLDSRITKERTTALYRITCGELLILEKIIKERILRYMSEMKDNDIQFGGVITKLCELAGVSSAISNSVLPPKDEFDEDCVENISNIRPKRIATKIDEELASGKNRKRGENSDVHDLKKELD